MNPLLAEGLTDAAGFLVGVLAAWGLSHLLGFDPLAKDVGTPMIGGVILAGLGGGAGVQLARRLRRSRKPKED